MQLPLYQVDAFASEPFEGNPAAVCPLEDWVEDEILQKIAMENNLSETAFFVAEKDFYRLRWFTPTTEVDLCGHATLASAHVLFEHLDHTENEVRFECASGTLTVRRDEDRLVMNFPAAKLHKAEIPDFLEQAIGVPARELYRGTDYLYVVENTEQVRSVDPDIRLLEKADVRGIIVTAPGKDYDFVSRFFAPAVGVDEDPVTGSAHTMLTPYWSDRLNQLELRGRQVSRRGGTVFCKMMGDRVELGGTACTFIEGTIRL